MRDVATSRAVQEARTLVGKRDRMPRVLVTFGASNRGGAANGPLQSLRGLVEELSSDFDFEVLAHPRFGLGSSKLLQGGPIALGNVLRTTPHDMLLLNSFYDREVTLPALVLRRLGLVPRPPAILSPRGEFSDGAMGLKTRRKTAYIAFARRLGLLGDVWLHATSEGEREDIRRHFPWARGYLIAPNIKTLAEPVAATTRHDETCRLAFLGRISPVKNLDMALRVLRQVRSPIAFDIYGPTQERGYWRECQRIIAGLPSNVRVTHKGEIANVAVPATLAGYDLFFLPTRGENFGHAILDALAAGLPVLISDRTPFRELERHGAGWSLPLDEPARFAEVIETVAAMSADERLRLRAAARRLAERTVEEGNAVARNREMLATVLAGATR